MANKSIINTFFSLINLRMKSVPLVGLWTSPIMKKPSFRVSLLYNINKYKNGHRDWFNKITDQILLGADAQKSFTNSMLRNNYVAIIILN